MVQGGGHVASRFLFSSAMKSALVALRMPQWSSLYRW